MVYHCAAGATIDFCPAVDGLGALRDLAAEGGCGGHAFGLGGLHGAEGPVHAVVRSACLSGFDLAGGEYRDGGDEGWDEERLSANTLGKSWSGERGAAEGSSRFHLNNGWDGGTFMQDIAGKRKQCTDGGYILYTYRTGI